eukprot:1147996-Pelagomonas_calceolata.AAC.4
MSSGFTTGGPGAQHNEQHAGASRGHCAGEPCPDSCTGFQMSWKWLNAGKLAGDGRLSRKCAIAYMLAGITMLWAATLRSLHRQLYALQK